MALITDLVSYYKLDTNATTQPDSKGSNDGTVSGATYTASGKINGGYSFDGTNDRVSITGAALKAISGSFSVSLWMKDDSSTEAFAHCIGRGTWQSGAWHIQRDPNDRSGSSGNSVRLLMFSSGINEVYATTQVFGTGNWHHIVITYDSSDRGMEIYIDGSSEGTATKGDTFATSAYETRIGEQPDGNRDFKGYIDEVGIWTRVLTSAEVTSLYNSGSGLAYPFTTGWAGKIWGLTPTKIWGLTPAKIVGV